MANSYYNVSIDDAIKFITSLSDDKIKDLYDLYDIDYKNPDVDCVTELASVVSDDDLYNLGYVDDDEDCKDEECTTADNMYNYTIDDVCEFLQSLDEDTIYNLINEYCAVDIDDLAIAITDAELMNLGFNSSDEECCDGETDNIECDDNDYLHFMNVGDFCTEEDEYDFLEDVDYQTPIVVIDAENLVFCTDSEFSFNKIKSQLDPALVSTCDELDYCLDDKFKDANSFVTFKITPVEYPEQVSEEVIINSELNPVIFDNDTQIMKPEVRKQLLEYIKSFEDKMADKSISVDYDDIQLIGSNAGYLYTPESDIDIHFIWSYPMDVDNFEQMRAEFVDFMTENPLYIDNYGVELNLEDGLNMSATTKRRYSIINDNWVDNSNTEEVYTAEDLDKVEGYEDVVDEYSKRIDDVIASDSYADAVALKQEIRSNRSDDLLNYGSLSMGNVVFKELRNNGKFGELRDFIKSKEVPDPVDDAISA